MGSMFQSGPLVLVGAGNMGGALLTGWLKQGVPGSSVLVLDPSPSATILSTMEEAGAQHLTQAPQGVKAGILFLAVKPNKFDEVIPQIAPHVKSSCIIVSIAAGKTIAAIEEAFGKEIKLVRAMPNTPALVGEAMSALCVNAHVTEAELSEVQAIFNSYGKAEVVPESLIDAVVGVSGSSPAYVYLFIEAMADAAVADGMPRAQAYKFAAQSVYGAAKMVLETGRHPGELKDAVCSPGGTTIEAVAALERGGLRDTVITAQRACSKKSHDMSTAK